MQGKTVIFILVVLLYMFLYKSDGLVINKRWYSPGRTDFVLDNKFYTFLERRSNSKLTDLRKAQLTLVSEQSVNKYTVNGDANDAAMIFFSLKPTSVTYKVPSKYRCGRSRCSRWRYRGRKRYYKRKSVYRKRRGRKMRKWVRRYGGQKVRKYNQRKIVRKSRKNRKLRRKFRKYGYGGKGRKVRRSRKKSRSKRKKWGKKSRRSRRRRYRGRWRFGRRSRKYRNKYFEASGRVGVYKVSLKIKPYSTRIVFLSPRSRSLYKAREGITRIYTFKPSRRSWWRLLKFF